MTKNREYSIQNDGYFGVTLLELDSHGAQLVSNTVSSAQERGSGLHFDEARPFYHERNKALTIEGMAIKMSSPGFAVRSLQAYATVARQMDELHGAFTR